MGGQCARKKKRKEKNHRDTLQFLSAMRSHAVYIPAAVRCVALKLRAECSKIAVSEVADVLSVVHRPSDIHGLCRFLNGRSHWD